MNMNCPECGHEFDGEADKITDMVECPSCGEEFAANPEPQPDDSMDGDAASALASAGMGTDEDYEHHLCDEQEPPCFGED